MPLLSAPSGRLVAALAACLALSACASVRTPDRADLVGKWTLVSVERDGVDLTGEANPGGDRSISLLRGGTFVVVGGAPNRGDWRYDPGAKRISLDSDLGPDDDSSWIVGMVGRDRMRWDGTAGGARVTIVSVRARETRAPGRPR